jgi:hypothetical protein
VTLDRNILHLEDDDNDSLFFQRVLERLNFTGTYRRTSSPEETIHYLEGAHDFSDRRLYPLPHVLVCDSTLDSVRTTHDVIRWLDQREEFKSMARFLLTGGMSPAEQECWLRRGVSAVFLKGGNLEDLAVSVEEILRRCTQS